MMTPQDLQEKEFVKAVFGGYDMASVDDFLERITEDYQSLYKENAVLKSKLKVLVEKVEEYRSTEDSMRMALLTAQKMGNEIVEESKEKGDAILTEVNELAKKRSYELKEKLSIEEARLAEAERRTSAFSQRVLQLIQEEQDFLQHLDELVIELPEPEPQAALPPEGEAAQAELPQARPQVSPDETAATPEAYLAAQVSQMTDTPEAAPPQPQQQAEAPEPPAPAAEAVPPEPEQQPQANDTFADFSKMFDLDETFADPDPEEAAAESTPPPAEEEENPFVESLFDQAPPEEAAAEDSAQEAEDEKIEIARSISQSLGDDKAFNVDTDSLWDDEGEPTTTRPKFDFDDLQFGSNFDDE